MNTKRKTEISSELSQQWKAVLEKSIQQLSKVTENSIACSVGESLGVIKIADELICDAKFLVETKVIDLMDVMGAAFEETSGALKKLKESNDRVSQEAAFIVRSLKDVQRKTQEVSDYADQLERLNAAMSVLQGHIDSGIFDVAARVLSTKNTGEQA